MRKLARAVELLLDRFILVIFAVMVFAIVWQVIARYVLQQPTAWSEELARFLLVWITMLGSALVLTKDGHVSVTVFVDLLPAPFRRFFAIVRDLLIVGMAGILAYYGYGFALAGQRRTSSGLDMPMLYPYAGIALGGLLIGVFVILRHVRAEDR